MKNLFIIGIDGLGRACLDRSYPNLSALMARGTVMENMTTVFPSISAQCWGSLLLGVAPEKHGYTNDSIAKTKRDPEQGYPSLFRLLREGTQGYRFSSFVNWTPINHGIFEQWDGFEKKNEPSDADVVTLFTNYIQDAPDGQINFIHLDEMDAAGHSNDYFTEPYYEALYKTDEQVGSIVRAIEANGNLTDNLIVVVTDHGGGTNPKGHGTDGAKDMNIFAICVGGEAMQNKRVTKSTHIMDIAPYIMQQWGVAIPKHMEGCADNLRV